MTKPYSFAIVVALTLVGAACDEKLSDVAGPTPNLEPARFLLTDGQSYQSLVGRASGFRPGAVIVIPGDPDANRYLIQKLEGRGGITGVRMPQNGPPYLAEGQISIIRRWIQLGAKND
jgi:hypothetical protein